MSAKEKCENYFILQCRLVFSRVLNLCELCDLLFSLLFVNRVSFPERNTKFAVVDGGEVVSCIPIRARQIETDQTDSEHNVLSPNLRYLARRKSRAEHYCPVPFSEAARMNR